MNFYEIPKLKTADEFQNSLEWHEMIFKSATKTPEHEPVFSGSTAKKRAEVLKLWQKQREKVQNGRAQLFSIFEKNTRRALVSEQFFNPKHLEKHEIESRQAASRFFGKPFLPKNFDWPRTKNGVALAFVAQINLSEIPKNEELPPSGQLAFFLDLNDSENGWPMQPDRNRVLFFEKTVDFCLADFPDDLQINQNYKPVELVFKPFFDLPDDRWTELFETAELPEKEVYRDFLNKICGVDGLFADGAKLLGWPRCVQGDVGVEVEMIRVLDGIWSRPNYESKRAEIYRGARSWRLLFEFPAGQLQDQIGDPSIYFLIKNEDLLARKFEQVALVMQAT